jgi:hypothetical protein
MYDRFWSEVAPDYHRDAINIELCVNEELSMGLCLQTLSNNTIILGSILWATESGSAHLYFRLDLQGEVWVSTRFALGDHHERATKLFEYMMT